MALSLVKKNNVIPFPEQKDLRIGTIIRFGSIDIRLEIVYPGKSYVSWTRDNGTRAHGTIDTELLEALWIENRIN